MAYYDRFDIVDAHYQFYVDYHEGQWSKKYARLCRISKYYKPVSFHTYDSMTENSKEIYNNLVQNNG